ncbi:tRNA (guanine-N(7)-)-methyltransferase [Streptohalobacillus salinus]|uniref:tRNA (guanine-N(7)-)-methyltransferase n=1 Tax=Streptohalobacillus salinus TaxID=621096 RepID=A0A2V3W4S6_9BACI|nr:tRNA (guanosine(46)-N7)-methyltransferase TrmB [Streptohalobacillus salinus]PXW88184.1 tRNA (guanine-N(7)-)-methyltransferase [Streptohalobacillus salinus]
MRARHKPWAEDYLKEHANIVVLDPIRYKGKWSALFGNDRPIHVEIGAGKGQFITGMAKQHPEINFIAIEVVKSIIVSAVDKVVEEQPGNVRLINFDAKDLREIFADEEVSRIYLNFSDPWPKTKHAKRRLTYPSFLAQYQQVLKTDGALIFKTDNQGLFEYSLISFSEFGMVLDELSLDLHQLDDPLNVMTEYEFKFSEKGQRIYRVAAHFIEK